MVFDLGELHGAPGALQREVEVGNIEYKLKLISPSAVRFEQLVTQLKYRIAEGGGQAIYEIGVADDGSLRGLNEAGIRMRWPSKHLRRGVGQPLRSWQLLLAAHRAPGAR